MYDEILKKSFYWVAITLIFRSPNTRFVTWMWLSYLKQIRNLEDEAVPFNNKWEVYKLFRIVTFL